MASTKGSLGPHFSSHTERTQQARELMWETLDDTNPTASAAAEMAYLLCAYCLVEERILKLVPPSPDLNRSARLDGDRTASEHLSRYLESYNIPATKGALQSSTFRGGYGAAHAKDDSNLVGWVTIRLDDDADS